ncbi:metalloregulator ArsR/SmtB family transcription factor [Candidatus Woesearchaeota archaeon]|nr:metalloregulator ArsR/SmtB family transcription factor [Candidatus Woesearchaeota archaeon]
MEEKKITLDSSTFKALASGTRVKILKTLEKRNHTQSELSVVLDMSIPTIKDHLKEMEQAGLVKRKEEGRKWIYYSLTEKSKCILDPERKRLWVVLSFFIISLIGSVVTITKYLGGRAVDKAMLAAPLAARGGVEEAEVARAGVESMKAMTDSAVMEASNIAAVSTPPETLTYLPYIMTFFIVVAIIFLVLSVYFFKKSRVLKK